jgi:hypothetical protein
MMDIVSFAIQILIGNPLTVSLIVLGVICVILSIIGKIPPIHIEGVRAIALAGFGLFLIIIAIALALILTSSTDYVARQPSILPTDTPNARPINVTSVASLPTSVSPISIQSNLLQNSGFENINSNGLPIGWTYDQRHKAGLDTTSLSGYDGKAFCSRQNLTENDLMGWVGFGQDIPVKAGQAYGFGGWVYLQNVIAFHIHIEWYTSNSQFIDWDQFTNTYGDPPNGYSSNGWIYIQGTKTVPLNASILRLGLWHGVVNNMTNAFGSFFCADNLELGLFK